jgi:CxxC-x17-CxxC domain-containing protein
VVTSSGKPKKPIHDKEGIGMSESEYKEQQVSAEAQPTDTTEFEDKGILCIDCGTTFVWTVGEQAFFRDKKLLNPPKRCKECKQAKNERLAAIAAAQASGVRQRIEVAVSCAKCGETTTVPFYPSQGRPVYCRSCFLEMNPSILNGNGAG